MSVRAYRINKIEKEKDPSFNLWNDTKFMDFMTNKMKFDPFYDLGEGGGQIELEIKVLKIALKELELEEYSRKNLKKDIKFAENKGDDYILYDCS